jgi:hypothetical protein
LGITTLDRLTHLKGIKLGRSIFSFDIARAFGEKAAAVNFRERIAEEVLLGARQCFVELRVWAKLRFRKAFSDVAIMGL